jgi:hypothetical protein
VCVHSVNQHGIAGCTHVLMLVCSLSVVVNAVLASVSDLSGVVGTRLLSRVCACWLECGHCPL